MGSWTFAISSEPIIISKYIDFQWGMGWGVKTSQAFIIAYMHTEHTVFYV